MRRRTAATLFLAVLLTVVAGVAITRSMQPAPPDAVGAVAVRAEAARASDTPAAAPIRTLRHRAERVRRARAAGRTTGDEASGTGERSTSGSAADTGDDLARRVSDTGFAGVPAGDDESDRHPSRPWGDDYRHDDDAAPAPAQRPAAATPPATAPQVTARTPATAAPVVPVAADPPAAAAPPAAPVPSGPSLPPVWPEKPSNSGPSPSSGSDDAEPKADTPMADSKEADSSGTGGGDGT